MQRSTDIFQHNHVQRLQQRAPPLLFRTSFTRNKSNKQGRFENSTLNNSWANKAGLPEFRAQGTWQCTNYKVFQTNAEAAKKRKMHMMAGMY